MDGSSDEPQLSATDALPARASGFPIVGIGSSAGGIQALQGFFRAVSPTSGVAYVVILHLSPEHESKVAEVLQPSCPIPVKQVGGETPIEPDHVYVIPPSRSLSIREGLLVLSDVVSLEQRRTPIDIFFRALAHEHSAHAIAVVLSGTGADGSLGIKRIKELNGLVLAQDPEEAEFKDMPRNSIATGLVDQALPVAAMPGKIAAYKRHLDSVRLHVPQTRDREGHEKALVEIFTTLRTRTGQDFSTYKRGTLLRRLERRMAIHEVTELPEYARLLQESLDEPQALLADLLISVTNFFRDPSAFAALEQKIIPALFEERAADDAIRVWVPACASGDEAYSIAMLLAERAEAMAFPPPIQLFATDLDESAIYRAREGFYTTADVADVAPERLRRFFVREQDGFRVRRELRERILFARHDVLEDPPFSHLDLVSCRNLLIYLNPSAQERVMEVLHFALEPAGYLFLGTSESVEGSAHLFSVVDKESHIFERRPGKATIARAPHIALGGLRSDRPLTFAPFHEPLPATRPLRDRVAPIDVHQRLLELYAPPSVVVDEEYDILHVSERAGRYLEFPAGEASLNLLRVVRPELRLELRAALNQAAQKNAPVEARGLSVTTGERQESVDLVVQPVRSDSDPARRILFLVLFRPPESDGAPTTPAGEPIVALDPAAPHVEEELARVKAEMRMMVEQYETRAEELKAANEELQAMNEELRSASEELETSTEELQSVNEELHTVNQELKIKIDELSHTNDDMRNLMGSTGIATIFVDRSLRVKLFTARAADIFNLIALDTGRSLGDITNRLADDRELLADIDAVLERLETIEREVATREGRWYLMRLLPYRTAEDRIDGVVLTFMDITTRKQAEEQLLGSREELERRVIERTAALQRSSAMLEAALAEKARLLRQVVEAQEEERRRVARELHDELGQHLTALKVGLESSETGGAGAITRLRQIVAEIDASVDRLALELRSPALDDLGLEGALGNLVDRFQAASGIAVDVHVHGLGERRLPPQLEITLYRVLQESLTNVWKHAGARQVSVVVERRDGDVQLIVEDDGKGFDAAEAAGEDAAATRFGLLGIRERVALTGGTVTVESTPGAGASLFVRVPIAPQPEPA